MNDHNQTNIGYVGNAADVASIITNKYTIWQKNIEN